jgi:hypothetical protein
MTILQHRAPHHPVTEPASPRGIPLGRITSTELRKMLPVRLLDHGQHRVGVDGHDGHGDPLRRARKPHVPHVHRGDQRADVADPADHRDLVGHRRVEPAQRPDDLHPGPAPFTGHRGQAARVSRNRTGRHHYRLRDRRRRQHRRHRHRRSGSSVGPDDRQSPHDRAGQRARNAGRLHARRARPRPSWPTSSTSSCCRPWR